MMKNIYNKGISTLEVVIIGVIILIIIIIGFGSNYRTFGNQPVTYRTFNQYQTAPSRTSYTSYQLPSTSYTYSYPTTTTTGGTTTVTTQEIVQ
ncbi:MAG: hypothetical protein V4665_03370 [Patescibacteria group bacterium]